MGSWEIDRFIFKITLCKTIIGFLRLHFGFWTGDRRFGELCLLLLKGKQKQKIKRKLRRQKGKIEKDKGDNPSPINPTGSSARALLVRISFFFDFGGGWCVVDCGPLFFLKTFINT